MHNVGDYLSRSFTGRNGIVSLKNEGWRKTLQVSPYRVTQVNITEFWLWKKSKWWAVLSSQPSRLTKAKRFKENMFCPRIRHLLSGLNLQLRCGPPRRTTAAVRSKIALNYICKEETREGPLLLNLPTVSMRTAQSEMTASTRLGADGEEITWRWWKRLAKQAWKPGSAWQYDTLCIKNWQRRWLLNAAASQPMRLLIDSRIRGEARAARRGCARKCRRFRQIKSSLVLLTSPRQADGKPWARRSAWQEA